MTEHLHPTIIAKRKGLLPEGDPSMPGLEGLDFISTGPAPGCEDCGLADLEDANDDLDRFESAATPFFSWSRCDACGTTLGGNREYAHARNEHGELVHFEVCTDCVMRINGLEPEPDA